MVGFKKARREKVWIKALLAGPSGSGKSYSALRLATGIAKHCDSRIAVIDTENGRIRYYANEFDFDDLQLEDPFAPESYIAAIDEAIEEGYKVIVIDSTTHEWDYCLEMVEKIPGTNSYTKWGKITPRHNDFLEKMLQSPAHIIATVRGKDAYVMEDKNGKQVPKKVGLGVRQRDGIEYEYTLTFNIDQDNHIATVSKDNTHLFENRYEVLTEKDGEALYHWANDGETFKQYNDKTKVQEESLESVIEKIGALAKSKMADGVTKEDLTSAVKSRCVIDGKAYGNYRKATDVNMAKQILEAIDQLKTEN